MRRMLSLKDLKKKAIKNINIVLLFIKSQNLLFAAEIFENILIKIISQEFKVKQSDFFWKYIYNNLDALYKKQGDKDEKDGKEKIKEWIINNKFKKFFELDEVLNGDFPFYDLKHNQNQFVETNFLFQLILRIYFCKYIKTDEKSKVQKNQSTSIYSFRSGLFFDKEFGRETNKSFGIISSFFFSVYIYCQLKQNPLMNYSISKENLCNLPFIYELSEADINDDHLDIVLIPIRLEPRIIDIEMNKNRFRFKGIIELCNALIFNRNIKKISINNCGIKSGYLTYLKYFYKYFAISPNKNIEDLDLSEN